MDKIKNYKIASFNFCIDPLEWEEILLEESGIRYDFRNLNDDGLFMILAHAKPSKRALDYIKEVQSLGSKSNSLIVSDLIKLEHFYYYYLINTLSPNISLTTVINVDTKEFPVITFINFNSKEKEQIIDAFFRFVTFQK